MVSRALLNGWPIVPPGNPPNSNPQGGGVPVPPAGKKFINETQSPKPTMTETYGGKTYYFTEAA